MKVLLLFYEPYVAGAENAFSPDITEVNVVVSAIPSKAYSQGIKTRDIWDEVFRIFGMDNTAMNATEFNARERFALFIDLRSMRENDHGSGLGLINTKEGVQLAINRKSSGSGNDKRHIFILSDAQLNIINREHERVTY